MVFGNASADGNFLVGCCWSDRRYRNILRGEIATLIPVLVLAQMLPFLSSLIALMCVLGSPSFLKNLIVKITGWRKTYQSLTGGKPHLAFAASVYLINRIGTKTFVLVELPDQLHIRRIYPDSSSESSYPETSFTVLGSNAAYKVFQQLAVGGDHNDESPSCWQGL